VFRGAARFGGWRFLVRRRDGDSLLSALQLSISHLESLISLPSPHVARSLLSVTEAPARVSVASPRVTYDPCKDRPAPTLDTQEPGSYTRVPPLDMTLPTVDTELPAVDTADPPLDTSPFQRFTGSRVRRTLRFFRRLHPGGHPAGASED
jgi:hypothetical protein